MSLSNLGLCQRCGDTRCNHRWSDNGCPRGGGGFLPFENPPMSYQQVVTGRYPPQATPVRVVLEARRPSSTIPAYQEWHPLPNYSPMTNDVAKQELTARERDNGRQGWEYRLVPYQSPAPVNQPVARASERLNIEGSRSKLTGLADEDLKELQRLVADERSKRPGLPGKPTGYDVLESYSLKELQDLTYKADLEARRRAEREKIATEANERECQVMAEARLLAKKLEENTYAAWVRKQSWLQHGEAGMKGMATAMRGIAWAMAVRGVLRWSKGHMPIYGVQAQSGTPWQVHEILAARDKRDAVPSRRVKGRLQKYSNPLAWNLCPAGDDPRWSNLLQQFPPTIDF